MGVLPGDELAGYTALGELSLDARVSPVAGVLPAAVHALGKERGLICPAAQGGEAAWAAGLEILAPGSLIALINHFKGSQVLTPPRPALEEIAAGRSEEHTSDRQSLMRTSYAVFRLTKKKPRTSQQQRHSSSSST